MAGPEATIERLVSARAENELGLTHSKLGKDGMPDDIYWLPHGTPILIEWKRPGEQPTKRQWYWIEFLRNLGYRVEYFDDADRAFSYLAAAVAREVKNGGSRRKTVEQYESDAHRKKISDAAKEQHRLARLKKNGGK